MKYTENHINHISYINHQYHAHTGALAGKQKNNKTSTCHSSAGAFAFAFVFAFVFARRATQKSSGASFAGFSAKDVSPATTGRVTA